MSATELEAIAPLIQTLLWISLILYLLWYFRKEVEVIRSIFAQRMESGSSLEIGPIKLGERIEKLENSLEETKENVEELLQHQRLMEDEFLKLCATYDPKAPVKSIDALGSKLKSHARGLGNLNFLKKFTEKHIAEQHFYGIGCAIQQRPQYDFAPNFTSMLRWIAEADDLRGFRLRVIYKSIQSLDNLLRLDNKREKQLIVDNERERLISVLEKLSANPRVISDDDANGNKGIGVIISRVKEQAVVI